MCSYMPDFHVFTFPGMDVKIIKAGGLDSEL